MSTPSFDLLDQIKAMSDRISRLEKDRGITEILNDDGTTVSIPNNYTSQGVEVIVEDTQPAGLNSSTDVGSLWYDSANNDQANFWDGFVWQLYDDTIQLFPGGLALDALALAVTSRNQTSLRIYSGAVAPSAPVVNWIWRNTGDNSTNRWDGAAWTAITDTNITGAVTTAIGDADMTDGFMTVFYETAAPGGAGSDDLWFDTDDTLRKYKWDSGNAVWVDVIKKSSEPSVTDGNPPASSPTPVISPGFGTLFVSYPAVANADPVIYDIYLSTVTPVVTDDTTFIGSTSSTFFVATSDAAGNALAANTTYYMTIIARDADGPAPKGPEASGQIQAQITQTEISDGAVSTPQLAANAVSADKIQANAVTAAKLEAVMAIINRIVAGDPAGARAEMNSSGLFSYDANGNQMFAADDQGNVSVSGAVQATDYIEATQSWRFDSNTAQVENLNVLGNVGASSVTTDSLNLNGDDLETDILNTMSNGAPAWGASVTGVDSVSITSANNGYIVSKFLPPPIKGNRIYAIFWHFVANPNTAGMQIGSRLTFTTDGTYPGKGSPVMPGSEGYVYAGSGTRWVYYHGFTVYNPNQGDVDINLKLGVWAFTNDSGNFVVKNSSIVKQEFVMIDLGPIGDTPNALQIVNMQNTADDPVPQQNYTKTWNAQWNQSYDGDGTKYAGGDNNNCYQGYYDSTHGRTKSLVGFDYSAIQSALSGATINSVKLICRVKHSYYNAGMDIVVQEHNNASAPANYSDGSKLARKNSVAAGQTVTIDLGTAFGNDLKNGNAKGVAFNCGTETSPDGLNFYGYLYGQGSGSAPQLKISYTK